MMATNASDDKQVTFKLDAMTPGFPIVRDHSSDAALLATKAGGKPTQSYFDALNATSDFWGAVASSTITFAPAVAPNGQAVSIASSGNVNLRIAATYTATTAQPAVGTIVGLASIATMNTSTSVSQILTVAVRLATMPAYLPLSASLFRQLLVPVYNNVQGMLGRLAQKLQTQAEVESPEIDAESVSEDVLESQSEVVESLDEQLVEEGLETMGIDWGSVVLSAAGLAPLVALPLIVEQLGHTMYHSVIVQNMTGAALDLSIAYKDSGSIAVQPGSPAIPAQDQVEDAVGHRQTVSYQANLQLINSTDLGSIGYVLALATGDGSASVDVVMSIPWAGDNAVWIGPRSGSAQDSFTRHSQPNGRLAQTAQLGDLTATVSINALSGETEDDSYFYCSTIVIEQGGGTGTAIPPAVS